MEWKPLFKGLGVGLNFNLSFLEKSLSQEVDLDGPGWAVRPAS